MGTASLLLTGGSSVSEASWRHKELENLIDSLPYFDKEFDDEGTKSSVKAMIQEEMKKSVKKPSEFISMLPPLPSTSFEGCPLIGKEAARVRAGEYPVFINFNKGAIQEPPESKTSDIEAWTKAVENAQTQYQHQQLKIENLELMVQYAPNAHLLHLQSLEAVDKRLVSTVEGTEQSIELLNRERKLNQQAAAEELMRMELGWKELFQKNTDIEAACMTLQLEIDYLRAQESAFMEQ